LLEVRAVESSTPLGYVDSLDNLRNKGRFCEVRALRLSLRKRFCRSLTMAWSGRVGGYGSTERVRTARRHFQRPGTRRIAKNSYVEFLTEFLNAKSQWKSNWHPRPDESKSNPGLTKGSHNHRNRNVR
jgi:hypothetical protein